LLYSKISRPDQGAFCFNQLYLEIVDMFTKQRRITRFISGTAFSSATTALLLAANLPRLWGTILQELGRGIAAMYFGGVSATLGLILSEEMILFDGHFLLTFQRLTLLTIPHLALGMLWQRYHWKGGVAALVEHLAWNQWYSTPFWSIPTLGMATIYFTLIFHKESQ